MAIAIASAFILPDLPHNSRGFSEDELRVAQLRMIEDVGEADADSEEDGIFSGLVMAFKDWKIWLMVLASFLFVLGLTFNAFFVSLPISLKCEHFTYHGPTAYSYPDSWLLICANAADVIPALAVLCHRVSDQRMARRQDAGTCK